MLSQKEASPLNLGVGDGGNAEEMFSLSNK